MDDLPPMMDYDIRHGRTYMYLKHKPLYPFGYGLSYTTFDYSHLALSSTKLRADGELDVRFDLKNTGSRAGDEVVQLYVSHLDSKVSRPLEELKAFDRVHLAAGETKSVTLALKGSNLAYWSDASNHFVVEPDQVELRVGASSDDIRLRQAISVLP